MEIKIEDYLSHSQMEEIAKEEFRKIVRSKLDSEKTISRIIGNAAYYKSYDILDNSLPEDWQEEVRSNVEKIVKEGKSYNIFRYNWSDNRPESEASRVVEQAIKDNKDKIIEQVNEIVSNKVKEDSGTFIDRLIDSFYNSFTVKFERGDS